MGFDLTQIPVVGSFVDAAEGHPNEIKAAYDKMIQQSNAGGQQIANFLQGREANAEKYYSPLQHMFSAAYGTEGLKAPTVPGPIAGSKPLATMYGGGQ